jgi:DNA-binding transcriptional ArsR family regulator
VPPAVTVARSVLGAGAAGGVAADAGNAVSRPFMTCQCGAHAYAYRPAASPFAIVYPAPFIAADARPRIPDEELLRLLRALADDTRLRALRLIADRPRSTQELAPLVGITEAGLSKHLRTLAEAGVLEARRDGYYVLYSLRPERVEPLSTALLTFLGREST